MFKYLQPVLYGGVWCEGVAPAEESDAGHEGISRCDKELGLYPTGNGELMKYFKQDSDMKQLFRKKK